MCQAGKPDLRIMTSKRSYERHLPHEIPEGFPIFLTWNLKGAVPQAVIENLRRERERLEKQPARRGEAAGARKLREEKLIFARCDRLLDQAQDGPLHLKDPRAAKIVEDSILFGVGERYDVYAWCIMANHVHALLMPTWELEKVTQGIKGYTAHEINGLQQARGRIFWQDESYDHWARDEAEVLRIIEYIERNPVSTGLCRRPEDWPWSSARFRKEWLVGQAFQPEGHYVAWKHGKMRGEVEEGEVRLESLTYETGRDKSQSAQMVAPWQAKILESEKRSGVWQRDTR